MIFIFFFISISMKFLSANRIAPNGTPRSAASHLWLCCFPSFIKRTPGLYELKIDVNLSFYQTPVAVMRDTCLSQAFCFNFGAVTCHAQRLPFNR